MNKSIFQKIKKSNLQSISQSPYSQQNIIKMSVEEIQQTLINRMNTSQNNSPSKTSLKNSKSNVNSKQIINNNQERHLPHSYSSISINNSKKIPEIMLENDQLKEEIQKLKNQKKLILSKYEDLNSLENNMKNIHIRQKSKYQDFSFKKSLENIQKLAALPQKQKQQYLQEYQRSSSSFRQNTFNSRQSRIRSKQIIPSSDSRKQLNNQIPNNVHHHNHHNRIGASLQTKPQSRMQKSQQIKQSFSTLQQRFYQYCKTQMVRMNTQNTKLTFKIGQLQTKLTSIFKQKQSLQAENIKLKQINQQLEKQLKSSSQRIQKLNGQVTTSLSKKEEIFDTQYKRLEKKIFELESQLDKTKKILSQKETQLNRWKSQSPLRQKQSQKYIELVNKNAILQSQLTQCMIRNRKISQKFRRMPVIDHLWEIKQVEYSNLIDLINKQKQLESPRIKPQKPRDSKNGFDLTFSKEKKFR